MDSPTQAYYVASGLAFMRGLDHFGDVMPKGRFMLLFRGCLETKGFGWVERSFIDWIIAIAGKEHRQQGLFPPTCRANCKYRKVYRALPLQRNALRVEIMEPAPRCGWNLKDDCIGGDFFDYHPCTHNP